MSFLNGKSKETQPSWGANPANSSAGFLCQMAVVPRESARPAFPPNLFYALVAGNPNPTGNVRNFGCTPALTLSFPRPPLALDPGRPQGTLWQVFSKFIHPFRDPLRFGHGLSLEIHIPALNNPGEEIPTVVHTAV